MKGANDGSQADDRSKRRPERWASRGSSEGTHLNTKLKIVVRREAIIKFVFGTVHKISGVRTEREGFEPTVGKTAQRPSRLLRLRWEPEVGSISPEALALGSFCCDLEKFLVGMGETENLHILEKPAEESQGG